MSTTNLYSIENKQLAFLTIKPLTLFHMYTPAEIIDEVSLSAILRCQRLESMPLLLNKDTESYYIPCKIPPVKEMKIPKKNRKLGHRIVYKAEAFELEDALKALKFYLNDLYSPHSCAHGFIKGRGIVSNAKMHLNKRYVLNVDIKDFFGSISQISIKEAFIGLGFTDHISGLLTQICTYKGKLVAGFPSSPTIANIVCFDMDTNIHDFCVANNLSYTRYADDISISGDIDPYKDIATIIESFGFTLNSHKTKLYKQGQSRYVTGLTVCDSQYPRVPRRFKRKIRQTLYHMDIYGVESHVLKKYSLPTCDYQDGYRELKWVRGWIDFINSIEPDLAQKYYKQYYELKNVYNLYVAKKYFPNSNVR